MYMFISELDIIAIPLTIPSTTGLVLLFIYLHAYEVTLPLPLLLVKVNYANKMKVIYNDKATNNLYNSTIYQR